MATDFGRYARREYERRWLLRQFPPSLDPARPIARISDHYIDQTRFRLRQRVRVADGEVVWKLTQKFPEAEGAVDRAVITNTYLDEREPQVFRRLPGRPLRKDRWVLAVEGAHYAVDVFRDALDGLILAEREYETHHALLAAAPAPFDGVDVTSRVEFTGGALAGKSIADLRDFVASILRG